MDHPIIPPPELVQEWAEEHRAIVDGSMYVDEYIVIQTSRYRQIADAELEACVEWCADGSLTLAQELRAARRPKPPSLVERALSLIEPEGTPVKLLNEEQMRTIRLALEQLQELKKGNE